jgi:hypothetical protein
MGRNMERWKPSVGDDDRGTLGAFGAPARELSLTRVLVVGLVGGGLVQSRS